ncbi:hypothetical protein ACFX2K_009875 [Malus domestica]
MPQVDDLGVYLGIPTIWGRSKQEVLAYIKERVLAKEMGYAKGDGVMGFRDLMVFNTALLAKQCWRLIHEPDSLWTRVLKDRYFLHDSFLKAKRWRWPGVGRGSGRSQVC